MVRTNMPPRLSATKIAVNPRSGDLAYCHGDVTDGAIRSHKWNNLVGASQRRCYGRASKGYGKSWSIE